LTSQDSVTQNTIACGICGKTASLRHSRHPGYFVGQSFDIYHCSHCNTSQAWPREVDPAVYEVIYKRAAEIPGYDRYMAYAMAIGRERDPLDYLADKEDIYWAIREVLGRPTNPDAARVRVLEIGCGLGYLTYALHAAGYDATGIDISEAAISSATARFGPHFFVRNMSDFEPAQFDVVIATEVIEHVSDPVDFVTMAARLVKPGGRLVLTSPNRTSYAQDAVWISDNPPVHLWWLSERSMSTVASRMGWSIEFVDFSAFNAARAGSEQAFLEGLPQHTLPFNRPLGTVKAERVEVQRTSRGMIRNQLGALGVLAGARKIRRLFHQLTKGTSSRRPCFCAVLTPP